MFFEKDINNIDEDDLQSLIDNQVAERKTIDYKLKLPDDSRDDKKEFAADISSFSNASGGTIIYGMSEDQGLPIEISGLGSINPDQEILRLDNMIRDNIKPRIHGVSITNIPVNSVDNVILIQIPRSWAKPHVVNYSGHWRFYSRNSAGKYPLDISEVRTSFRLSETIVERIKLFRSERIGKIIANEAPLTLSGTAQIILHIAPLISFDSEQIFFDVSQLLKETGIIKPIYASGWNYRINFDGLLSYKQTTEKNKYSSYVQIFRNGIIEAVDENILRPTTEGTLSIPGLGFEREVFGQLSRSFSILKILGISPPLFIMLSLFGVSGYIMTFQDSIFSHQNLPIDRDELIIPEIYVEDIDESPSKILKPIFDSVWNAAGWKGSINYDDKGNWKA